MESRPEYRIDLGAQSHPTTPLRQPNRRLELVALMERRRLLRIELADTEDMLLGLVADLVDGRG